MAAKFTSFQNSPLLVSVNNVPFGTPAVDNTKDAYLSLSLDPDLTTGASVTMNVWINNTQLGSDIYASEHLRVLQHNIPAGTLQPNNMLTLIKAGGLADIEVSDCIVHYKT